MCPPCQLRSQKTALAAVILEILCSGRSHPASHDGQSGSQAFLRSQTRHHTGNGGAPPPHWHQRQARQAREVLLRERHQMPGSCQDGRNYPWDRTRPVRSPAVLANTSDNKALEEVSA
mmetsp:Transcript_10709/g.19423  ORF Transcript_10709/g.19423 Transcript_10709/m.19423 type:complete len:118 (-) Transcript_10709:264-617(-)